VPAEGRRAIWEMTEKRIKLTLPWKRKGFPRLRFGPPRRAWRKRGMYKSRDPTFRMGRSTGTSET